MTATCSSKTSLIIINPLRAFATRVTVIVLCFCVPVSELHVYLRVKYCLIIIPDQRMCLMLSDIAYYYFNFNFIY